MKNYFRIWVSALLLCMLAVFASACKDDEVIGGSVPGYPDGTQEIMSEFFQNK